MPNQPNDTKEPRPQASDPVYEEGLKDGEAGQPPSSYNRVYYEGYLEGKTLRAVGTPAYRWEPRSAAE